MMTTTTAEEREDLAPPRAAPASSTRLVTELADLSEIAAPEVNVCVLRRGVDPDVEGFVRAWLLPRPVSEALFVDADAPELTALAAGAPHSPGREAFLHDVRGLISLFADLTGCPRVGVRLARLDKPMCPRLHADMVTVRLVTTYAGPGTEWAEHAAVRRDRLGHRANGVPDEKSGVLRAGARLRAMEPFNVGLLKGESWPGNQGRGAVHRSPPGAQPRVVVTLDALA
ncbi:DUF1826 domain-containing protein [Sorangium sp. So ce1389]|uniref:DUF1826 domain-containing protein n=1 Tax=Sorangium sp. So ce1389 TaxID=3133336 RepID=UPI003F61CFE0